jgi:hypothetical protein
VWNFVIGNDFSNTLPLSYFWKKHRAPSARMSPRFAGQSESTLTGSSPCQCDCNDSDNDLGCGATGPHGARMCAPDRLQKCLEPRTDLYDAPTCHRKPILSKNLRCLIIARSPPLS